MNTWQKITDEKLLAIRNAETTYHDSLEEFSQEIFERMHREGKPLRVFTVTPDGVHNNKEPYPEEVLAFSASGAKTMLPKIDCNIVPDGVNHYHSEYVPEPYKVEENNEATVRDISKFFYRFAFANEEWFDVQHPYHDEHTRKQILYAKPIGTMNPEAFLEFVNENEREVSLSR